ncbi:retrotransposon protein, putative, ty1-copia subclass [Tanacetum coccineum]
MAMISAFTTVDKTAHNSQYADALVAIGDTVKDKDLVMLVVSGLREEYNGLKITITARQSPTAFSELHALLSDHDYMFGKTHTPIAPYGPQAFYGARPSNNNMSNNNNRGNRNNSRGNNNRGRDNGHIGANSHVTPDLEAMDNSEAYYCDDALHVGNGPAPLLSFEGRRYFMLCVDHRSRYMWIYHLAQKSDVYSIFKSFVQIVERQFTTKLKNVQTDWGGEFRNLASFFSSLGIIHRRSCPHTISKTGFVECRESPYCGNRSTLLAQAVFPQRFGICFDTSIFTTLTVSSPSSVSHLSPTSQTSPESFNGQLSPVSPTSIPTPPPPPIPPPPPPPITRNVLQSFA